MSKVDQNQEQKHHPRYLFFHRLTSQLSIQPNIPSNLLLGQGIDGRKSSGNIVTPKSSLNFPTKTLRTKSLLWTKPTGVAITSLSSTVKQLLPTLVINLAALSSGLSLGFSAIAIPQLKSNATWYGQTELYQPFNLNMESGSWIASIFGLGAIFGGFAAGYLGTTFGQRKTMIMLAVPDIVAWIFIASAQNIPMMLFGRFLAGFSAAGYSPTIQTYIAEIAQPQHRGWLGGLTSPILAFGALLSYCLGSLISWHYVAIIGIFIPLSMIPGLFLLPDTPYWYIQQGDEKKALQVIEKFREQGANSLAELWAVSDGLRSSITELSFKEAVLRLTQRQYRRPFLTLNFLFVLTAFTGNFAITFYAVDIFQHSGNGAINSYLSAIIIGAIKFLGAILYIPAVKYISRRMLICGSSFVMGTSMSILGLAMYSHESGLYSNLEAMVWLPLVCITIYMLADPIGVGSVPFLYLGEFFPAETRSILSGITVGLSNLNMFIVVKTFPSLTNMVGDSGTFWLYSSFCFVMILYTLVWIPETKGRTLQDIEQYFNYKENRHVTPFATPVSTPNTVKRGLDRHQAGIQFTL
jgi:facilitated trehalose transporter